MPKTREEIEEFLSQRDKNGKPVISDEELQQHRKKAKEMAAESEYHQMLEEECRKEMSRREGRVPAVD